MAWRKIFTKISLMPRVVNPQTPVAQKSADEVVFRQFQGEEVEFFLIGRHIFWKLPI